MNRQPATVTIRKGRLLYHGTAWDFSVPRGPFWVTNNRVVAAYFANRLNHLAIPLRNGRVLPRVLVCKLRRSVRLREFEEDSIHRYAVKRLGSADYLFRDLTRSACDDGFDGWIMKDFYPQEGTSQPRMEFGHDIMLCDPSSVLRIVRQL